MAHNVSRKFFYTGAWRFISADENSYAHTSLQERGTEA